MVAYTLLITGTSDGRWVFMTDGTHKIQALVFSENSTYGINNGNVSKLWIRRTADRKVVFNYDRGHDVDESPAGLVEAIIKFLGIGGEGYAFLRKTGYFG